MKPQEKAEELYNKFWNVENLGRYSDENGFSSWSTIILKQQAKDCALIAVDELILLGMWTDESIGNYWKEVKQEIKAL